MRTEIAPTDVTTGLAAVLNDPNRCRPAGLILVTIDLDVALLSPTPDPGEAGEELMSEVLDRINRSSEPGDEVYRTGLDEVAIVRPTITAPAETASVAHSLFEVLSRPYPAHGGAVRCPVAIGHATSLGDDGADTLITCAEHALETARTLGFDQVVEFDDLDRDWILDTARQP